MIGCSLGRRNISLGQKFVLGTLKTLKLDHDELLGTEAQKRVLAWYSEDIKA